MPNADSAGGWPAEHCKATALSGAASSLLALTALVLYDALGSWQADRVAALIVAAIPAAEA
jgi:divalent metal cation (Fe/Co/Zn/Cd) transporter